MKWIALKAIFISENKLIMEDLVSNIFIENGISGLKIDLPEMDPEVDWADDALPKPEFPAVTGYIARDENGEKTIEDISRGLNNLAEEHEIQIKIVSAEIDEEDWAESWKAFFWPEKVGERIVVKPSWRDYQAKEGELILEIDPGMAFGSGSHPTTCLCIRMLERYLKEEDSVLDIGTGSGILLIAAALLGAGKLTGTDNDPQAIKIAEKNLLLNKVDEKQSTLFVNDLSYGIEGKFNLIVSNILAEVLIRFIPDTKRLLLPSAFLILSGIIEEKVELVENSLKESGFCNIHHQIEKGWAVCIAQNKA